MVVQLSSRLVTLTLFLVASASCTTTSPVEKYFPPVPRCAAGSAPPELVAYDANVDEPPNARDSADVIRDEMKRLWRFLPHVASVHVGVSPKGEVLCSHIEMSSGDEEIDVAALRAVRKMSWRSGFTAGTPVASFTHITVRSYSSGDETACAFGLAWACHAAGHSASTSSDAVTYFARGCRLGELHSCVDLGRHQRNGVGTAADVDAARRNFAYACERGEAQGCTHLGLLYDLDYLAAEDGEAVAAEYYRRACDGGDSMACNNLGVLVARGQGQSQDDVRALQLFEKACAAGNDGACDSAGLRLAEGRGVPQDLAKGLAYLERACRRDSAAGCTDLGFTLRHRDRDRALRAFQDACSLDATTCSNLAGFVVRERIPEPSVTDVRALGLAAAEKACSATRPDPVACGNAAEFHLCGWGGPRDLAKALTFAQRGCDDGRPGPCDLVADIHAEKKSTDKQREALERGCRLGGTASCSKLGVLVEDPARALALHELSCSRGDADGCARLAEVLARDVANEVRARELAVASCAKFSLMGCRLAAKWATDDGERARYDGQSALLHDGYCR